MAEALQAGGWPAWLVLGLVALSLGCAVAHAVRPSRRTLAAAVLAVAITIVGGLFGTALGLTRAFAAVARLEPARKSAALARSISEAMNCTAFALGGTLLWSVPFVVGEVRRRRPRALPATARAAASPPP